MNYTINLELFMEYFMKYEIKEAFHDLCTGIFYSFMVT